MLFGIHIFATLFMTGLIWFVQVVHYPMFSTLDPKLFKEQMEFHQQRTGLVVLPIMLAELITGLILLMRSETRDWYISIGLLGLIWLSTIFLQIPCHKKLIQGFDQGVIKKLVLSNWIRTVLWTVRSFIFIKIF